MIQNVTVMNLLIWAVFGLAVGYIVHVIDPRDVKGGIFGTAILGILGALLGGYLASFIVGHAVKPFSLEGFLMAVGGGLILAFLSRFFFKDKGHIKTSTERLR